MNAQQGVLVTATARVELVIPSVAGRFGYPNRSAIWGQLDTQMAW